MKILTKEEQIRQKIREVEASIEYTMGERNKIYKKKRDKDNYPILSTIFIRENSLLLEYTYQQQKEQIKLLSEYQDLLTNML